MDDSVTVRAPGKINLILDIIGKRTDGYHFIRTIMQSISIYDKITVKKSTDSSITISCNVEEIPCDNRNVCFKVAKAFYEYNNIILDGLEIDIEKEIPAEAGLGGGSADAAGVLIALNLLYDTELSIHELAKIGVQIGADIPFCLTGGTAIAEGIGEILTALPNLADCYIVIAKPKIGISTAEAFLKYDLLEAVNHPDCNEIIASIAMGDINEISKHCTNILESVANIPEINEIKSIMLENNALCASMSGSGSACFGIFEKKKFAASCIDDLKKVTDFAELCSPASGIEILN